jgi:hypothetical protein
MLKKDSMWLGMAIGLVGPLVGKLALDKAMFVSVALNIVPIRYYFISAKMDRTGRGVLAMTVILIVAVTLIHI